MKISVPLLCAVLSVLFLVVAVSATPPPDADPAPQPLRSNIITVYEWGAQTASWDGSPETNIPFSVPGFYHKASELNLTDDVDSPVPVRPHPPRRVRKPVVYFDASAESRLNVRVTFSDGDLTWLYPKPTALIERSAYWHNLRVIPAAQGEDPPQGFSLGKVDADHWGAFSRDGSTSYVLHGEECERFLFYEGNNRALPEVDVYRNADGQIVVANRTGHPVHDVRFHFRTDDGPAGWYLMRIGAEESVVLDDEQRLSWADFAREGRLTQETRGAGLTQAQAEVFERAWQGLFFQEDLPALSFRRDRAHLDMLMRLDVTAAQGNPEVGVVVDMRRVGYMFIHGVDLDRQAEYTGLIDDALAGDEDAASTLRASGPAAITALRLMLADDTHPKAFRDAAQKLLHSIGR